jgi:hypothetical protein
MACLAQRLLADGQDVVVGSRMHGMSTGARTALARLQGIPGATQEQQN